MSTQTTVSLLQGICRLIHSYLSQRTFRVHIGTSVSPLSSIAAGVPQGSVLGPTLFLLYTSDFPILTNLTTALFADDSAVIARNKDYGAAVATLQTAVDRIAAWAADWKLNLNETKSVRVDFTLRPHVYIPTIINGTPVPVSNQARYLGLHLDSKLNWQEHVKRKRELLNLQYRKFYWLVGHQSSLSLANKRLIYTSIFQPMWAYGCEIWGTTCRSNQQIIERFLNKYMRTITRAPWFITNNQLRTDLRLEPISSTITARSNSYVKRLHAHPNLEAIQLLDDTMNTRRLHRLHTLDLIN